jgi:hypothetical protein
MPEPEFRELVEDIRQHGLQVPLQLWKDPEEQDWLIDGRTRVAALCELGIAIGPQHITYWQGTSGEIAGHLCSLNINRRHLEARDRIRLAVEALQAGEQFEREHVRVPGGHKRRGLVSRIAEAAQLSRQSVYANADLLPEGAYRPESEIAAEITEALDNLPPPESRRGRRGGRTKETAKRIAEIVGVCPATVKRHIAVMQDKPSNGNNGNHPAPSLPQKHLRPDDLLLLKASRLLEQICGEDISDHGAKLLKRCSEQLTRIGSEYRESLTEQPSSEAETTTPYLSTV